MDGVSDVVVWLCGWELGRSGVGEVDGGVEFVDDTWLRVNKPREMCDELDSSVQTFVV